MSNHRESELPTCHRRHQPDHAPLLPASAGVCPACRERAAETLDELPGLFELCAHALDPRPAGARIRVRGRRPRGIDLRDTVVAARSKILGVLTSWCELVTTERGVPGPQGLRIRQLTDFLGTHLAWLLQHPAAPDLVDELTELVSTAYAALRPDLDSRIAVGPCSHPGCDRTAHAEAARENDRPYEVSCADGHTWPATLTDLTRERVAPLRSRNTPTATGTTLFEGRRRTVPTQLAALAAGVTEATIRKWASRGKITRYGRRGRAEYDLREILKMAAEPRGKHVGR